MNFVYSSKSKFDITGFSSRYTKLVEVFHSAWTARFILAAGMEGPAVHVFTSRFITGKLIDQAQLQPHWFSQLRICPKVQIPITALKSRLPRAAFSTKAFYTNDSCCWINFSPKMRPHPPSPSCFVFTATALSAWSVHVPRWLPKGSPANQHQRNPAFHIYSPLINELWTLQHRILILQ